MQAPKFAAPAPPVVGGHPKHHSGTRNHPPTRVVIHSAVAPCEPGMARRLGTWNAEGITAGSWHYAVDPVEVIQCSYDRYVCWHAPPNPGSIGIEMADNPAPQPTRRPLRWWRSWRWADANHRAMLDLTAKLTAELLLAYDLPLEYVTAAELRAGAKGWTTHAQVSAAWHQSTHWDPGWWPRRKFGRMVKAHADELYAAQVFA